MGMFDYVRCRYAVPGEPGEDVKALVFQTKDLACEMAGYTITEDGRLLQTEPGFLDNQVMPVEMPDFSGDLTIYTNNIRGTGPGIYTQNGEPAHFLEYQVAFVDGKVNAVKELRNEYRPAAPYALMHSGEAPHTKEETERILARRAESLIGRELYLLWGGQETGYPVKVVAENARELVVENPEGRFEKLDRAFRDHLLWDTENDAFRARDERKAEWQRRRDAFDAYVAAQPKPVHPKAAS